MRLKNNLKLPKFDRKCQQPNTSLHRNVSRLSVRSKGCLRPVSFAVRPTNIALHVMLNSKNMNRFLFAIPALMSIYLIPSAAYAGLELRSVLVDEWTCEPELQTRIGLAGSVTSGLFPVCKLRPVWRIREVYVPDIPQNGTVQDSVVDEAVTQAVTRILERLKAGATQNSEHTPQNSQNTLVNPLLPFPSPSTSQPTNPNPPSILRIPISPASPRR
jgi:hypothetical protein